MTEETLSTVLVTQWYLLPVSKFISLTVGLMPSFATPKYMLTLIT